MREPKNVTPCSAFVMFESRGSHRSRSALVKICPRSATCTARPKLGEYAMSTMFAPCGEGLDQRQRSGKFTADEGVESNKTPSPKLQASRKLQAPGSVRTSTVGA